MNEGRKALTSVRQQIFNCNISMVLPLIQALVMAPSLRCLPAAMVLLLGCTCVSSLQDHKRVRVDPLSVPRANPHCWKSSSALLLEMRIPRIADTVPAFWDLMVSLRSSGNSKHTALFWDLAQVFWDLYLDCMLSRSHGLGRRHVRALHSLFTDKSFSLNGSGSNYQSWLSVRVRHKGHIKTLRSPAPSTTFFNINVCSVLLLDCMASVSRSANEPTAENSPPKTGLGSTGLCMHTRLELDTDADSSKERKTEVIDSRPGTREKS